MATPVALKVETVTRYGTDPEALERVLPILEVAADAVVEREMLASQLAQITSTSL